MRAKELRVIDSHFHFCDYVGFNQIALAAGYTNTEECLHKAFQDNNIVHGVVMGNKTLDPAGHHYPDYMSYCIGLDSNVFYDDMDLMTAQVEENLKRKQCCGIKLYPGYNHVYVYDELYDPIYELARKYNKPVAIHTGLTATANALLKYSHPMTLDEAAVKYPDVQFVMCHIVLEVDHMNGVEGCHCRPGKEPQRRRRLVRPPGREDTRHGHLPAG